MHEDQGLQAAVAVCKNTTAASSIHHPSNCPAPKATVGFEVLQVQIDINNILASSRNWVLEIYQYRSLIESINSKFSIVKGQRISNSLCRSYSSLLQQRADCLERRLHLFRYGHCHCLVLSSNFSAVLSKIMTSSWRRLIESAGSEYFPSITYQRIELGWSVPRL